MHLCESNFGRRRCFRSPLAQASPLAARSKTFRKWTASRRCGARAPERPCPTRAKSIFCGGTARAFFSRADKSRRSIFIATTSRTGGFTIPAGDLVAAAVDSETLNRYRDDPGAIFAHEPPLDGGVSPRAYGGVARVTLAVADEPPLAATVLTYHFAFRHSGLPAKISPWKKALLGFGARDWHQLDHYTAVFIALDSRQNPAAVMLQQHNYLRAWLIGEDPAFAPGRRIEIDAAIDSNELYPHRAKRAFWRSANFMSAKTFPWLARIADAPPNFYCCGEDETRGEIEQEYEIETLPPDDAFYVFEGRLGERRWLPGRDGPPGAIYNTWPALAKIELMLPVFYWRDNDREYAEILKLPLAESITAALERDAARALLARLRG